MDSVKRHLLVSVEDIMIAMENNSYESVDYLNLADGSVVMLSEEIMSLVEDGDWDEIKERANWQQEEAKIAKEVLSEQTKKYLEIPKTESYESYELMERFAENVKDNDIREQLCLALSRRRPFRGFKDIVDSYEEIRQEWFDFKKKQFKKIIIDWLSDYSLKFV